MARGVSRKPLQKLLVQPLDCQIEATNLKHSFLYMPECPVPLLGWDLLSKFNTKLTFIPGQLDIEVPQEQACALQAALLCQGMEESPPAFISEDILQQGSLGPWATVGQGKPLGLSSKGETEARHSGSELKAIPLKGASKTVIQAFIIAFLKCKLICPPFTI